MTNTVVAKLGPHNIRMRFVNMLEPGYLRFPRTPMSPRRNRKGENSRRQKRTLLKKAYEYKELSGSDIAIFTY